MCGFPATLKKNQKCAQNARALTGTGHDNEKRNRKNEPSKNLEDTFY